jgi:archaemetzincin
MRLVTLALSVLIAQTATAAAESRTVARPTVCLVPLGNYEKEMLPIVTRGIAYLYRLDVKVLDQRALPRAAWYPPRRRYRAEKLLSYLDSQVLPRSGCNLVMGFTSADISTTKDQHADWGILGLAWIGGPSGVVSTHRLGRRVDSRSKAMRAVKVMNHELGHVLGLDHHDVEGCLMEDAGGTVKTVDRESGLLCDESRRDIEELRGFPLPVHQSFDWDEIF